MDFLFEMEKVLFAVDELTGLIGAAALMRPSKSVKDMELKSVKKKFKDKHFAAGCDREVIKQGAEMLGWLSLPEKYDRTEYDRIKKAAEKIRKSCDIFIVIGIGGSYLGSRAVIEFLRSPRHNRLVKDAPEIFFSGCNISSSDLSELLELCEGRDVCINVISKSGTTTEPAVAFRIFRSLLEKKNGKLYNCHRNHYQFRFLHDWN